MTWELKKYFVLINDLQYIFTNTNTFSIILNAKFKTNKCHNTVHINMHMVHWGEYWAILNKQMAQWNAQVHRMQNTVVSVITVLTSMDFVQKTHVLYICTDTKLQKLVICVHSLSYLWITHPLNSTKFQNIQFSSITNMYIVL